MEDLEQLVEFIDNESFASKGTEMVGDDDFGQLLVGLYKQNRFYHILTILPPFEHLVYLIPCIRLIVALTLFRLGRFKGGLRELAIAIEMEPQPQEKERLIHYEIRLLNILKLSDRVQPCRNQIDQLKRIRQLLSPDMPADVPTSSLDLHFELDPIHVQGLNYVSSCGVLNNYSIGKIAIIVNELVEKFMAMIEQKSNGDKRDPLPVLFEAIKYFGPLYLFEPIVKNMKLVKNYMDTELAKYPELDLSMDIKSLVVMLVKLEKSSSSSLNQLANLIIKHQLIHGFLEYLVGNYKEASTFFIWVLQFISVVDTKISRYINKTEFLSYLTKRISCILLTKCIEFGDIDFSDITLRGILARLVENSEDINITCEFTSSRLYHYFISCGIVYERLAIKESKSLTIGGQVIERYDSKHLEEMIRKYIIASALTPQDDSKILVLVDRILFGLLMYGGIHLQTIWFFLTIKNYYQIALDFSPIHYHSSLNHKIFAQEEIDCENFFDILNKISELSGQITDEEMMNLWEVNDGQLFLVPIIFKSGKKLLLMEEFYDEKSSIYDKDNFVVNGYNISVKLKSQCKTSTKSVAEKFEVSKEFIDLWMSTYERYQGNVPEMIRGVIE